MESKDFRRFLRYRRVKPEFVLWQHLRSKRFFGLKFRRQHDIGKYIVDFYCHAHKLVIEIDGKSHDTAKAKQHDRIREEYLKDLGLTILRFSNDEVNTKVDWVLDKISQELALSRPLPGGPPSPGLSLKGEESKKRGPACRVHEGRVRRR